MIVLDRPVPRSEWAHKAGERNGVSRSGAKSLPQQSLADAGPWEPAVQKIVEFQHLGDDWDGLGAKAPSRELLASAVGLAYLFFEQGVRPPSRVVPGLDGAVLFEWQDPDGTCTEVEIVRPLY